MGKAGLTKALTKATKKATSSSDDILGNPTYVKNQKSVTNTSDLDGIKSKPDYTESAEYKTYHEEVANTRAGVNNNTTKSAGTKVDSIDSVKATEVNTVKTTKTSTVGKVLGVSALAGATAFGGYSLASNLSKSSNLSPAGDEDILPTTGGDEGDLPFINRDKSNLGETDGVTTPEEADGTVTYDWTDGTTSGTYGSGESYYETAGESGGDSIADTIQEFLESASPYFPYILIGIACLFILFSVTKKGRKTTRKTTSKKKLDVTAFGGLDSGNF